MSPPALDSAIIAAMQANPAATQLVIRKAVGASEYHFSEAVKRLRHAGKLNWHSFALSPSMMPKISPTADPLPTKAVKAKEGAGNARRGKRAVPDRSTPDRTLPGPSTIADKHRKILARLEPGPQWIRSFQLVKAHLNALIEDGLAERCRPHLGRARNQVKLTDKGRAALAGEQVARVVVAHPEHRPTPKFDVATRHAPTESIADRIRRLAREADEEELAAQAEIEAQERRERDLERLTSPSAVLRLAQRDWPGQCEDVAGIAKELGIGLGECWRRVIKAGVDCLRDCDGEAAA
jgi:DNA-binding MarR family transcriptional regulator